jgi:hypothetical protein
LIAGRATADGNREGMAMGLEDGDYGAFMEKFELLPSQSQQQLPLHGLTFAIKDM